MRFLLVGINAKYIHSNPAIYSLKAYAEGKTSAEIITAEYTINQQVDYILEDIYEKHPDAIGFSCYIWNIEIVKKLLPEVIKLLPGVDIFLGGPEVSYNADTLKSDFPFIKEIMVGEGERRFLEILKEYEAENVEKDENSPISMDDIPFFYENEDEDFTNRIIYYESQRGCPFRCSYCLSSIDKSMRYKSLDLVKKDIEFFLNHRVPQVKFVDRTFNCNHERTVELLRFIRENDNGVTNFHFEVAGDIIVNDEMTQLQAMRAGAVQLEIGVQTTNPKTLEAINRKCNLDALRENVEKLRENHNIHLHLDLIAGLPYEDYDSFKNSFNDVYNMKPDQLQLGFLKLLKGTQIDLEKDRFGIVARDYPPYEVMFTDFISFDELSELKKVEEMVELYYNSAQFTTTIPLLIDYFDTPFDFYHALAMYYEKKQYFLKSPARSRKYEILLEFAGSIAEAPEGLLFKENGTGSDFIEKIREALTLDYYLREKPKSKPDFVRNVPGVEFDYEHRDPITGNFYMKNKERFL